MVKLVYTTGLRLVAQACGFDSHRGYKILIGLVAQRWSGSLITKRMGYRDSPRPQQIFECKQVTISVVRLLQVVNGGLIVINQGRYPVTLQIPPLCVLSHRLTSEETWGFFIIIKLILLNKLTYFIINFLLYY